MMMDYLKNLTVMKQNNASNYRFFTVMDYIYGIGTLAHLLLLPTLYTLGANVLLAYNVFSIIAFSSSYILNRKAHHNIAFFIMYIEVNIHSWLATYYLGWETGFYLHILVLAPIIFFNTCCNLRRKIIAATGLSASFFIMFSTYHNAHASIINAESFINDTFLFANTITTIVIYSCIGYYYGEAAEKAESKLRTAQKKAETQANTDQLTKINNRHAMAIYLEEEVERATLLEQSLLVVLCDIDNFKKINDSCGHEYGDHVLSNVASVLQNSIRKNDRLARWGGEEFMILLPNTSTKEGLQLTDRLREKIANLKHDYRSQNYPPVTMTFGLSCYAHNHHINDCINEADKALYAGKLEGKNRVVFSETLNQT